MKGIATLLILSSIVSPVWAVQLDHRSVPVPVGVMRLGELESEEKGVALSRIERSIEKWLDKLPIDAAPKPVVATSNDYELRQELSKLRLRQVLDGFYSVVETDPSKATSLLSQLEGPDLQVLLDDANAGPERQQVHFARAALLWRNNEKEAATKLIRAAVYEHPLAQASIVPQWGWDGEGQDSAGFEQMVARAIRNARRPCRLDLSIVPRSAEVRLNGFVVDTSNPLNVVARSDLNIAATASGHLSKEHRLSCDKLGSRRVRLILSRGEQPRPSLSTVARENAVKSLLLVTGAKEEARLFLFTPGLRVDSVPTSKPILLADFQGNDPQSQLPILSDGFSSLVEAHRVAWLDRRDPLQPPADFMNRVHADVSREWYNDWKVWAVVGGIVGGVVITYLATRQPQVQTNPAGLKVRFE